MDRDEAERLRREMQAVQEALSPPQPASEKWEQRGSGLVVHRDLDESDINLLVEAPNLERLYFDRMPAVGTWTLLNDTLFSRRPEIGLAVCNWGTPHAEFASLDFLDHLPNVRDFQVSDVRVGDTSALLRHPGLEHLFLSGRSSRALSLDFLGSHPGLRSLGLCGLAIAPKGIERVSNLPSLESFTTTHGFPSLSFLVPLQHLRHVRLSLGGNHDMDSLGSIPNLEQLELSRVRMLSDLSGLGRCRSLKLLTLQELTHVERVSFVARVPTLEELRLLSLKRLGTLDGVAGHPTLRRLTVYPAPRITGQEWSRLRSCPKLAILLGAMPPVIERQLRRLMPQCCIVPG